MKKILIPFGSEAGSIWEIGRYFTVVEVPENEHEAGVRRIVGDSGRVIYVPIDKIASRVSGRSEKSLKKR